MKLFEKMFGTHSQKEIKRIKPLVDRIIALRPEMMALSDEALRAKTDEFKKRYQDGETLDSLEEHIITEPTIVRIPPYWWHCPLEYRRVTKPVYFEVLHLRGEFGTFQYREIDGEKKLVYTGFTTFTGRVPCVKDASKKCDRCGKCGKKAPQPGAAPQRPAFIPAAGGDKCVFDSGKTCDYCGRCGKKKKE